MRALACLVMGLVVFAAPPALAADSFEGTFARSAEACKAEVESESWEDSIRVSSEGVSGYEMFCSFVELRNVRDGEGITEFLTPSICGDDSGTTRPDTFYLSVFDDGKELILQSQNEYVVPGEGGISGPYVRCD
jgi:hypothetical protein